MGTTSGSEVRIVSDYRIFLQTHLHEYSLIDSTLTKTISTPLIRMRTKTIHDKDSIQLLNRKQYMKIKGITMIIRSLMGGGAERVMSTMANYWVSKGIAVTIITSVPPETDAYTLDHRVKRIWLAPPRSIFSKSGFPWNIGQLRKHIDLEGNKVVISFMDRSNIPVILATLGMDIRVIVGERIDPRTQNYSLLKRLLMRICYPHADAVTVLTDNVKKEWGDRFVPPHKVHVIHNPVLPLDVNHDRIPQWLPKKFMCCMGRLHPQKGFDILFNILPEMLERWPEYDVVILGEGESRHELEEQADRLGISHRIFMPGFIKNPHSILQRASLFIFPSRFEGFPNALVEAMALGLPVVSVDCPSGPACLIRHQHNGLLVPPANTDELAAAIDYMLSNPKESFRMGQRALLIKKKCDPEHVMTMWTALLEGILYEDIPVHKVLKVISDNHKIALGINS